MCHKSTEGTDFWFGFMQNRDQAASTHYVAITVTSREATNFTITVGPSETLVGNYSVGANNSLQVRLNWQQVEANYSQNTENKAIHIKSIKPVNVYAFNYSLNSSDVAVIYPINSLGNEYYSMCYEPHFSVNGRNSEFLIVGIEDGTKIEITPSKVIDGTTKLPVNKTYEITLNKGQIYQAQSENIDGAAGEGDLTGSYFRSDKPFALYSGALATTVPSLPAISAWDHLYEQMPPIQSWGREFYTVPLKGRVAGLV